MTDEQNQVPSIKDQPASNRLYTAEVGLDETLQTTTISLSFTDQSDTSRNTLVCIVPEFGSNLFRFRVGEHDLIYTDQALLKKRDHTGTIVLWPFPNRVHDKRNTYQGQQYSLEDVHRPALSIIDYKQLGMQLHIPATDDFTHQVIFTPEHIPAFCIEYQTCSTDAINLHRQGTALREAAHLLEVQPGATYSGTQRYSVVFTA